jgi:exopolyphosphatase/guanosine-5'-triphosphate,3'-diphosphate pyrophosphatase
VRSYVREALADVRWLPGSGDRLVGLGGAVRNLAAAALSAAKLPYDLGVQGYMLAREPLAELIETLAAMPAAERGEAPGIKPGRGDLILAAALAIEGVLKVGGFDGIEATEAGLREGVLIDPQPGERDLLSAAAMLHDVGMTISYDDHHKHSRYLIVSAELPGFDPRERALIAQISRYHRKGAPKLGDMAPIARPGDDELVARCSVLLRLAEHLERGRDQSVRRVRLRANGHGVDLHLDADGENLILPRWSVERYGDGEAFERVFGRRLLIG